MFSLVLFSALFVSAQSPAAPKCSSKELLQKTCDFYRTNKNKPELRTSDGRTFKNPLYFPDRNSTPPTHLHIELNKNPVHTIRYNQISSTEYDELDLSLELEAESEELLSQTDIAKLPPKSRRAILRNDFLRYVVDKSFPLLDLGSLDESNILIPDPLDSPNSRLRPIKKQDLKKVIALIGTDKLNKLKGTFAKYEEKLMNVGSVTIGSRSPPAPCAEPPLKVDIAKEESRIQKLVDYSKEQLILLIKNGRSDQELSPEQKIKIKKVETIKYSPASSLEMKMLGECDENARNAFYRADLHIFSICPGLYGLTDSHLMLAIGHELGHSIDPCRMENSLVKIDQDKLRDFLDSESQSTEVNPEKLDKLSYLKSIARSDATYSNMIRDNKLQGSNIDFITNNDAFEVVAPGIPMAKSPFESVRQCLLNEENFDSVTDHDVEASLNFYKSILKRSGAPKLSPADETNLRKQLIELQDCIGTPMKGTEHNEAMCDFYGAFVQSRFMAENPPKSEADLMASFSYFSEKACSADPINTKLEENPDEALKIGHPSSNRRLQNIIFKMPGIARHLGCELHPPSKCFKSQEFLLKQTVPATGTFPAGQEDGVQK